MKEYRIPDKLITEDPYVYLKRWQHIEALKMCIPKEMKKQYAQ